MFASTLRSSASREIKCWCGGVNGTWREGRRGPVYTRPAPVTAPFLPTYLPACLPPFSLSAATDSDGPGLRAWRGGGGGGGSGGDEVEGERSERGEGKRKGE